MCNMLRFYLFYLIVLVGASHAIFYDSYKGMPISEEEYEKFDKSNKTFWCVNDIEPCDPDEGRRGDGSCNNLDNPSRGAAHTPVVRVLPPVFRKTGPARYEPVKDSNGNDLPLARYLRQRITCVGKISSQVFTTLGINYWLFMSSDILSLHDSVKYVLWKTNCCSEEGKKDYECAANEVPIDDPVHRFSGVRCLNMTRPETFQSIGCINNDTIPERIISSTPVFDLSMLYGNHLKSLEERGRLFRGGLLKYEIENGRIWPPSYKTQNNVCYMNRRPKETRCHEMPEEGANALLGLNLLAIWFWRYHNFIAGELAKVNPCWDDNKLFEVTRDINTAVALQIYYYELCPLYLGYDNMVKDGIIDPNFEPKDEYNPDILPQISLEYPYVLRYFHNFQEGTVKLYDKDGYYLKQVPIVNLTLRTGYLAVDNNIDHCTQGSIKQACAQGDYMLDPDITEQGLGALQKVADIVTNDLSKNRYFFFQSYTKYREVCFGKPIKSFKDLRGIIDDERIEILRELYPKVENVDLMAGIYLEKPIRGGFVPPTFYCLVIDQLKRSKYSDRHWFERPNRPNAFTLDQLAEIRKVSIAKVLCDVGDTITRIQPYAFLRANDYNKMVDCDCINQIDFSAWADKTCTRGDDEDC